MFIYIYIFLKMKKIQFFSQTDKINESQGKNESCLDSTKQFDVWGHRQMIRVILRCKIENGINKITSFFKK